MNIFTRLFGKKEEDEKVGGMQDYMMLIRVYFQAAIAAQVGINNIAMLPDMRVFKNTFHVKTEHNKLGMGEKNACRRMLKDLYGHDDAFFKEIDKSVSKNCRKMQDVQTFLYQFQGFTQDLLMLLTNLLKYKLRMPAWGVFKKALFTVTEDAITKIFTKNDFDDPATLKAVASVRKYNQRLNFTQEWITAFAYQVIILAKKEKQPEDSKG